MFATTLIVGIMASARKTNGYAQGALVNKLLATPWQTMYKIHNAAIWKKYVSKGTHDLADLYASATALETCVPNFKTTWQRPIPLPRPRGLRQREWRFLGWTGSFLESPERHSGRPE